MSISSRDPIERRDAVRKLLRGLMAKRNVPAVHLARMLGYSQQRFSDIFEDGTRKGPQLADLAIFVEVLGVEVLEALAAEAGYRLVPDSAPVVEGREILAAASAVLVEAGEATRDILKAAADGRVTPSERAGIKAQLDDLRRVVSEIEAALGAAEITPISAGKGTGR